MVELDHRGCGSNTAAACSWIPSITLSTSETLFQTTSNTDKRFTRITRQCASPHPTVSQGQFRASCEGGSLLSTSFIWENCLLPLLQGYNVEMDLPVTAYGENTPDKKEYKSAFFLRFMEGCDCWVIPSLLLPLTLNEVYMFFDQTQTYCIW